MEENRGERETDSKQIFNEKKGEESSIKTKQTKKKLKKRNTEWKKKQSKAL